MYFKSFISSYCAVMSVGLLMVENGREWKKSQDNLMEKGMYFHCALCLPVTVTMQPSKISRL